jgi:hypothetical protein
MSMFCFCIKSVICKALVGCISPPPEPASAVLFTLSCPSVIVAAYGSCMCSCFLECLCVVWSLVALTYCCVLLLLCERSLAWFPEKSLLYFSCLSEKGVLGFGRAGGAFCPPGSEGVLKDPEAGGDSRKLRGSLRPFEQEGGTRALRMVCLFVSVRFAGLVLSLEGAIAAGVSPPLIPEVPEGGASVILGVPTPQ